MQFSVCSIAKYSTRKTIYEAWPASEQYVFVFEVTGRQGQSHTASSTRFVWWRLSTLQYGPNTALSASDDT